MQSGYIENFKHLSNFKDIQDFNNNIEQWMIDIKKKFTKSELVAFKRLIRFSAKIAGVCNARIGTVVAATHDRDGAGISRSTFKRTIAKAKEYGVLLVHETERKNGSQSSNVYVFNRFISSRDSSFMACSEPPEDKILNPHETNNLSKAKNNIINTRNTKDATVLDASFVSDNVPNEFTNLAKCYFNDAKKIEEYWKLVTISSNRHKVTDAILDTAILSFKVLIRKIKLGKVTNTYGFFYGVLNRKFKSIYVRRLFTDWWEKVV